MGIMYQQRMDMISDDIWMDKPPVFHGFPPSFQGFVRCSTVPPKNQQRASPAIYKTVSPSRITDETWFHPCPFGKNRGAGAG
jgi:hypothetical protein